MAIVKLPSKPRKRARIEKRVVVNAKVNKQPSGEAFAMEMAYKIRKAYNTADIFGASRVILENCIAKPYTGLLKLAVIDCQTIIWKYVQHLLAKDYRQAAAIILWGPETFTPEPRCTQLVWNALRHYNKNLVQGGGSQSKSWSGAVSFGLDYIEDPEWTCFKVMSVTGEHAKRNIFANLKNLLGSTIVPVPNIIIKAESIQVNNDDKQGIHLVTIPQGDDGKGRLRGFHPVPRKEEHPKFGKLSRVGVLLDEAEEIPGGVWEDLNNILLTDSSEDTNVQIFAATNPKDPTSKFGEYAEPVDGWASIDIETTEEWESARGWHVTRLDPAKSENVMEKRVVFPGLQTYEGYENLLKLGANNPEYYTMGRGWFPPLSAQTVIITEQMFHNSKGRYHFIGPTIAAGSADLAFEGNDQVIYTHARTGVADGWWDQSDAWHQFKEPRRVIQIEQQMNLPKLATLEQTRALMKLCKDLGVKPPWMGVDRTGNGTGVHDALCSLYGDQVMGVMFGSVATDTKILDDDTKNCSEIYRDIITEMAFAVRRFMETDTIKMNPGVNWNTLERQTVTRQYSQIGRGFVRIESKKEFKKRHGGKSPDNFDSLIICVNVIRANSGITAVQVETPAKINRAKHENAEHGIVDSLEFVDMS